MKIPFRVRFRSLFVSDKDAFWWKHFTDEERALREMDAWQLGAVIHDETVRPTLPERRIVAEHLLNVRLAQIQSTAAWGAGVLGFIGAILGAVLSIALAAWMSPSPKGAVCAPESANEKQAVPPADNDHGGQPKPIPPRNPKVPSVVVIPPNESAVKGPHKPTENRHGDTAP